MNDKTVCKLKYVGRRSARGLGLLFAWGISIAALGAVLGFGIWWVAEHAPWVILLLGALVWAWTVVALVVGELGKAWREAEEACGE